jgi:hypothetical protein
MSKHPDPNAQPISGSDDLDRNPGIGQSSSASRDAGLEDLEGENTVEGDVDSEVDAAGGVDPEQRARDHP